MPELNLLPWREHQCRADIRRLQRRLVIVGLMAVLTVGLTDYWGRQTLHRQWLEAAALHQAGEQLDGQLAKVVEHSAEQEQVQQRLQTLEQLQGQRLFLVELFAQLERALPEGVYLTAVTREGERLYIQGLADSGALVAHLLRGLSSGLGEATLQQVNAVDEGEAFDISVTMRGKA
ncbi:PilN domain-containing protein [Pseudomonas sp. H9]|uniref:PilN domain-containing protein n=1 Tax=Pseudomonas sp. H9 TaxID=483968 RepID=UPI0010578616|nr:PilN domain-containing protein [Pseudomonas sp. H9]TDF84981.1 fimbrial protein [Pseudomonas sp. H9]